MLYVNVLRLLTLLVGCFYPAFASYKVLSGQKRNEEELRMWMSYWIVYGVFVVFDFLTTGLVAFIPFLNEMKLLFLFWLLPTVGGGNEVIYEELLRTFFSNNEFSFDQVLIQATLAGGDLVGQLVGSVLGQLMAVADSCFLSRGHRPALQITPSIEDLVNDVIAKRQLNQKRKQMANLSDTINEVLGDKTDRNSTLSGFDLINESESDLLVIKDHISRPKERPLTAPKPMRQSALGNQDMDLKPEVDLKPEMELKPVTVP
ncbi:receptor expression-enhancing protein 4 [Drosophila biarmipes]|uniref:receptor expression-enhancing protein 4 n=1 Tax=Drosophila biarmipes TaxID=125945 RepID=UPI0007E849D8|nr:receptor expression-enhancing protein 4 [Drosophila biarmipes]